MLAAVAAAGFFRKMPSPAPSPRASEASHVTFNREVAPILFNHCASCHRPGQAAPFSLLTYADASKRAGQIAEVTQSGYMPPWLPLEGHGEFAHSRRLSAAEREVLARWVANGALEGNPADLPPAPVFSGDWQLGEPDLVVDLPACTLAAEGDDVYRNLVAPIPVAQDRYVRGVEFLPGNARVVHHAFINVDETGQSRRLAARQNPPGFDGMPLPDSAVMPGGQLLSWQPGKIASFSPEGLAWTLRKGTDLVLQLHLNPSGKEERVQPRVGFYFTDRPPRNSAFRIKLAALKLDIPPGEPAYAAEESYTLPATTYLMRVGAHAHYLGREIRAHALLPNGTATPLLAITNWDFKWQGDYQYAKPVLLPAGTRIVARFVYDNSTNNVRNPFSPPRRVRYGLRTVDEMGELYFQALPAQPRDYAALAMDHSKYLIEASTAYFKHRIELDPSDADANARLGRIYGSQNRFGEGIAALKRAIQTNPNHAEALLDLAQIYLRQKKHAEAAEAFRAVIRIDPQESQAHGSLGILALQAGQNQEAQRHFAEALRLNPDDPLAGRYLQQLGK